VAAIDLEEIEDAVFSAYHKAATLKGVMDSPRGRQKTDVMAGLVESMLEDIDTLAAAMFEARKQAA
jgi:hypothetical protein